MDPPHAVEKKGAFRRRRENGGETMYTKTRAGAFTLMDEGIRGSQDIAGRLCGI